MIIEIGSSTLSLVLRMLAGLRMQLTSVAPWPSGRAFSLIGTGPTAVRLHRAVPLILAVLLSLWAGKAGAQLATAEINGTVHDQTAALVPGATVTATQPPPVL